MDKFEGNSKTTVVKDLQDLANFAKNFLSGLDGLREQRDSGAACATIVTLRGNLGSGKTAFVKECAKVLGVEGNITSPTFVIMKRYPLDERQNAGRKFTQLIHIDAYRLGSPQDLKAIGWSDLVRDPGSLIMLEWPERVEDALQKDLENESALANVLRIEIEHKPDGSRVFTW